MIKKIAKAQERGSTQEEQSESSEIDARIEQSIDGRGFVCALHLVLQQKPSYLLGFLGYWLEDEAVVELR